MYIVIAGAGEVGNTIARSLSESGHNVAIIDRDKDACARAEVLDALVINGNAAAPAKLEEAYINSADILIAVTGSDEINMLSCAIAKSKGCKTLARINSTRAMNINRKCSALTDRARRRRAPRW